MTDRQTILPIALILVLVLAGCNGLLSGSGSEIETSDPSRSSVTPAPVPTDSPTPTPAPQLPPGVERSGVNNSRILGNAHASALQNVSYTIDYIFEVSFPNGTTLSRGTIDAQVAANKTRYKIIRNSSGVAPQGPRQIRYWADGQRFRMTQTSGPSDMFNVTEGLISPRERLGFERSTRAQIAEDFGAVETRLIGRETRNGTSIYGIEATNVTHPDALTVRWVWTDPRNVTLNARVDERGIVREYEIEYVTTLNGDTVQIRQQFRYTNIGETEVELPPWSEQTTRNISTKKKR